MNFPNGWTRATMGELVSDDGIFTDGDWIESKDQDPNGDVRLIQLADVGDGVYLNKYSRYLTSQKSRELNCTHLVAGDVLIARMPDPLGRACVFPGDQKAAVTAVDVCIVRTGSSGPNHHWLIWFVNAPEFRNEIALLQSGSTRKRISRKNLATIALPLPPLPEQHRIVAEIEKQFTRLDASVAALQRAQVNLKRYRASVLKAACQGELVPTEAELARAEGRDYQPADQLLQRILAQRRARWEAQPKRRGQYKEPLPPDTSDLPELPEGWLWATVAQLSSRIEYGTSSKAGSDSSGMPVLRMGNIQNGELDFSDLKYLARDDPETLKTTLIPGDLLFNRTNSAELVGKTAVYKASHPPASFASYLIRVSLSCDVAPAYVCGCINSQHGRLYINQVKNQQVGQANVNGTKLAGMPVPLPPLAEQRRIVAEVERRLSVIQQAEATVEANLKRAERLRQSILQQAFSGKLVPQDPNDEPASALLERIKAEREAARAAQDAARKSTRPRRRRAQPASNTQLALPEDNS